MGTVGAVHPGRYFSKGTILGSSVGNMYFVGWGGEANGRGISSDTRSIYTSGFGCFDVLLELLRWGRGQINITCSGRTCAMYAIDLDLTTGCTLNSYAGIKLPLRVTDWQN